MTGCTSRAPATPTPAPTPAFSIAAVIANFTDECRDPAVVDELFCEQVQINRMTAEGDILNVPTNLEPGISDRAKDICRMLAVAHFDSSGKDLGYEVIGILDRNGGNAAACSV